MDNAEGTETIFQCPSCSKAGFTEDTLWYHWPKAHGRENASHFCPICDHGVAPSQPRGNGPWGFSSHLFHDHGPAPRRMATDKSEDAPSYSFALVVCRHPKTGKFLLVEEGCSAGFWLPAGRVDPGESFQEAAIRECVEEAGIEVSLKGILRIEHSPFRNGGSRMRVVVRSLFSLLFLISIFLCMAPDRTNVGCFIA